MCVCVCVCVIGSNCTWSSFVKETDALCRELTQTIPGQRLYKQLSRKQPLPITDWVKSGHVTQEHTVHKLAVILGGALEQTVLTEQ